MPNHLRIGTASKTVAPRRGKTGFVKMHVDVEPRVKDALIEIAQRDGVPYAHVVRDALDFYLDAVGSSS